MSNTNTGGPAFPHTERHDDYNGMTLRDYLAAKAMQADLTGGLHEDEFDWLAARSYKMANAMLKAREA
jgi:hypothetical protein